MCVWSAAPDGCLHWFTSSVGTFSSFNYQLSDTPIVQHLANQDYTICIRMNQVCSFPFVLSLCQVLYWTDDEIIYFQRVTVAFATISAIIQLHRRTLFVYPRKRVCTMPTACTIGCKFRVPQTGKARVSCFPAIQWAAWTRSAAMHSRQTQAPHLKPFIVSYLKDKSKIVL